LGISSETLRALSRLYHRKTDPQQIISYRLGEEISRISSEIKRQVGLLINRKGHIEYVMVGEGHNIFIPSLERRRLSLFRLNGLRCVHTHLFGEDLDRDDLLDLALLRLDFMAAIEVGPDGTPHRIHAAHLLPGPVNGQSHSFLKPLPLGQAAVQWPFLEIIESLEKELSQTQALLSIRSSRERALLVSVTALPLEQSKAHLNELEHLARSAGLEPVDRIIQRRSKETRNPKFFLGKGKLGELCIRALQSGAGLLIFDQDLTASQVKSLANVTDLKIVDRSQLILDIFAQRAQSREGKIQVELAQLKYLLPRLVTMDTTMSRLMGGIGGRGPGETKLEVDRRRARERISRLQQELKTVRTQRDRLRKKRRYEGIPVVSLVGYTNAGKSTLLNTLTRSSVITGDQLFATLDPTSRRLFLSPHHTVILTDTVGFIRDLPQDLKDAFKATLEELNEADLLVHVVDVSNPVFPEQMQAVEDILTELDLEGKPRLTVFNKSDLLNPVELASLCRTYRNLPVSAIDRATLSTLLERIEQDVWKESPGSIKRDHGVTLIEPVLHL
jgi:GTPase